MKLYVEKEKVIYEDGDTINVPLTLDCGQAFRWKKCGENSFCAPIGDDVITVSYDNKKIEFSSMCDPDNLKETVAEYFDLYRDYTKIESTIKKDKYVAEGMEICRGIRILKQQPFEALISFIISQNNNVPRIKGIIDTLCRNFGNELSEGLFSFPKPETLAKLTEEDLAVLHSGYRAAYIIDASQKVYSGEINLDILANLDDNICKEKLLSIKGVGGKVAACVMLFGLGKLNAFPMDVWMKRVVKILYSDNPDFISSFGGYAGVAQQYLFVLARIEKYLEKFN